MKLHFFKFQPNVATVFFRDFSKMLSTLSVIVKLGTSSCQLHKLILIIYFTTDEFAWVRLNAM